MGEFTIQCTVCDGSFGSEVAYNSHGCIDDDTKLSVKIKLEPEEEEVIEKAFLSFASEDFDSGEFKEIKSEPIDVTEHDENKEGILKIDEDEMSDPLSLKKDSEEEEMPKVEPESQNTLVQDRVLNETETFTENYTHDAGQEEIITGEKSKNRPPTSSLKNYSCNCKVCGAAFLKKEEFTKHFREQHKTYRPYECGICGKKFLHKHYVNLHMRVHTGEKPYVCKLCPRSYSHKTSFTIHMRIHNGERPYACGVCGKKCYDKSGLTSHMRSHTKETPYQCEVCGRRFTHSKSLLVHRRNHTGEKPYICSYCGKAFRHWHKHKIHVRLHTGERPYKCKVCGKGFPRNDEVSRHMRSHQGIKTFKCSICGVYCATQASITGHINLHHSNLKNEELEPPPEKTLVKDSTSGILGTKAHEPRSLSRIANRHLASPSTSKSVGTETKTLNNQTKSGNLSTRVIEVTSKDTRISIPLNAKKMHSNKLNCVLPSSKASSINSHETKAMNYQEFLKWQERMLANQGLIVKGYSSNGTESSLTPPKSKPILKSNIQPEPTITVKKEPVSSTPKNMITPLGGTGNSAVGATKPQYLLLSQGGEGNVTKILLPINMMESNGAAKQNISLSTGPKNSLLTSTNSSPQVPNLQSNNRVLLVPQAMSNQQLILVSNGGQGMLLMNPQSNQALLQPALASKTDKVVVKQEPSSVSGITIKTENPSSPHPPMESSPLDVKIKEEPNY